MGYSQWGFSGEDARSLSRWNILILLWFIDCINQLNGVDYFSSGIEYTTWFNGGVGCNATTNLPVFSIRAFIGSSVLKIFLKVIGQISTDLFLVLSQSLKVLVKIIKFIFARVLLSPYYSGNSFQVIHCQMIVMCQILLTIVDIEFQNDLIGPEVKKRVIVPVAPLM